MAVLTYVACAAEAEFCALLGFLPPLLPLWWAAGVTVVNCALYYVFKSGLNLRARDPSLTQVQLILSLFATLALISQADEARGALILLLPIPLLFGVLRLTLIQMARIGALGLTSYFGMIAAIAWLQPWRIRWALEFVNLISLTSSMVFVCLMCGYISSIRQKLANALETVTELAQRDSLTGLFNRRAFMEKLEFELLRSERRSNCTVALCMIDLDYFKKINDIYGHPVGDEVLIATGHAIQNSTRTTDHLARYGGEEFIVMLDVLSHDTAMIASERIRAHIARIRIGSSPKLSITASIGIAFFVPGETSATLIERADQALYQAKANGRNRVVKIPATRS